MSTFEQRIREILRGMPGDSMVIFGAEDETTKAIIEATLDCLPEKKKEGDFNLVQNKSFNAAIDQTRANIECKS